jgi:hypothetical protein
MEFIFKLKSIQELFFLSIPPLIFHSHRAPPIPFCCLVT